ncbi:hypothetical protein F183_A18330 [Bryobacterales bacterium F-183]|nr:hypothetical protein F183_A18330 [Bryobacterales bacterium F-183]
MELPNKPTDRRPIFSYVMLSRVSLFMWLVLLFFLPLAKTKSLGAYLIGMYDLYWTGALLVGAATFLLAMAINVSANTIMRTAELRFGMKPLHEWFRHPVRIFRSDAINSTYGLWRANVITATLTLVATLYFFSGLVHHSRDGWMAFAAAIAGFFACFLIGYLFALYLTRLKDLGAHGWYVYLVRKFTPDGFVLEDGTPVPGHQFSANSFLLSLVLYLSLGFAFSPGNNSGLELAALVSLLLLLTNLCWLLSGLSYLLDRWRFPLLLFIFAVAFLSGGNDHVFPITECQNCQPAVTPAQILDTANPDQPRVLVATSGGGILAASWTATVLGELTEKNPSFASALRLISSVSGGSVGAMHYVQALQQNSFSKADVFKHASDSSLDAVAWGLAYHDSWRVLGINFDPEKDRALELRKAWTRHDPNLAGLRLSQWPAGKKTPALMINSTVAETGDRFSFTNFQSPSPTTFWNYYPNKDIEINAAVANSAAFPYVSPASRASSGSGIHLLDGGYYDNFGVASVLDFLSNAYPGRKLPKHRILVILIEASKEKDSQTAPAGKSEGWGYQLTAPPGGLLRMWQIAARQRNYEALKWLEDSGVDTAKFVYEGEDSPTSWHLTENNKKEIQRQYSVGNNPAAAEKVSKYLASFLKPPASSDSARKP